MAGQAILTVNAGSSSLKIALFVQTECVVDGEVKDIGGPKAEFVARDADGQEMVRIGFAADAEHEAMFAKILPWVRDQLGGQGLHAAGHRVVHGGRELNGPALVDERLMAAMQGLVPLAPLHQPHCLAAIRAVAAAEPRLPQVACFDTAFHRTMPDVARRFAIPRALHDEGIERYGFHGLSYDYIAGRLAELDPALAAGRVVVAHLGSGASLCALQGGRSVDTTMGLTALDGLPMGTRCGAIDPGVLLYLLQEKKLSPAQLEDLLYHRSGLLGVSGESADMRELAASGSLAASEAMELFAFHIARQACAMASSMGGLDGLVFTAGIGAHDSDLRRDVCERLGWLGVRLERDAFKSAPVRAGADSWQSHHALGAGEGSGEARISAEDSRVRAWVIPTDEAAVIVRQTAGLVQAA